MKELPEDTRPQEKLLKHGAEILSNCELIALLIRSGTKENNALAVSQQIIDLGQKTSKLKGDDEYYGLKFLVNATCEDLTSVPGIGKTKACQIMAAIELGRRAYRDQKVTREKITDTTRIPNIVMDEMRYLNEEHFKIAILNTKKELEYIETISIGSLDKTIVEPREVFLKSIKRNAHTIILLHNHPSGDPKPSNQDINITRKLISSGELLGISVIDHIIIGDGRYYSFLEEGIM
ncbi:MAG: DNA repair protein RadC [Tissierellia bacterium]|nr:DNA repair protein RadC [Tissierellia bacterium]